MDGWVDEWMDAWMDKWTDGWMERRVYGEMDRWRDGWMNKWVDKNKRDKPHAQHDARLPIISFFLNKTIPYSDHCHTRKNKGQVGFVTIFAPEQNGQEGERDTGFI